MHMTKLLSADSAGDEVASSPSPNEIGERLRALRSTYGLTQRELARRTGLAHGTISFIESGRVSPSVLSLAKLLAEFRLSINDFFHLPQQLAQPMFFRGSTLPRFEEGERSFRLIDHRTSNSQLQIHHEHYGPGADTGDRPFAHEGEEAGVVIRGKLEVTVANRREVLGPGDAYQFQSRLPHRFRNVSDEVCEVVSVCTPAFIFGHGAESHDDDA